MRLPFDLPARIALFPLSGAVLMPRARLPLHIFEPRYLQLLDDTLKTDHRLIGMIQPEGEGLASIGCAGRIRAFSENDDGRMMIALEAVSRFRLSEVEDGFLPYLQARIDWSEFKRDRSGPESDDGLNRDTLLARLDRYMTSNDLSTDWAAIRDAGDEALVNALSMMLPFSDTEKQALLEAPTLTQRRELLDGLIEFALHNSENHEDRLQ
ncbi:LON peptidase substrate-binding domain-containing protein [Paracoccus sp. (in: a-proteobacteria)]|uniref:LON peptidase substrate-binding domain-containing protein n=1 Tax=Paracoccus sp. TaxID=267 RepID=UPI003A87E848